MGLGNNGPGRTMGLGNNRPGEQWAWGDNGLGAVSDGDASMFQQMCALIALCFNAYNMFQQPYVYTALCSRSSMFPHLYALTALCSHFPMFPQIYALCLNGYVLQQPYVSIALCVPQLSVPTALCSHSSLFSQFYTATALYSHNYRTLTLVLQSVGKWSCWKTTYT